MTSKYTNRRKANNSHRISYSKRDNSLDYEDDEEDSDAPFRGYSNNKKSNLLQNPDSEDDEYYRKDREKPNKRSLRNAHSSSEDIRKKKMPYSHSDGEISDDDTRIRNEYYRHLEREEYDTLKDLPRDFNNKAQGNKNSSRLSLGMPFSSMNLTDSYASNLSDQSQKSYSTGSVNLLRTEDVKKKSFLVGSSGSSSLMGEKELSNVLADRHISVFSLTWNVQENKTIPKDLEDILLPDKLEHVPDVFVISCQECEFDRFSWEVALQEALGPGFVLYHTAVFGSLYTLIFLKRQLTWYCSLVEEATVSIRIAPQAGKTKGALGLAFMIFGSSFLIINCHLSPHEENWSSRLNEIKTISTQLALPKQLPISKFPLNQQEKDKTDIFDYVIWMGDLNVRLDSQCTLAKKLCQSKDPTRVDFDYEDIKEYDELFKYKNEEKIFVGYHEGQIHFLPSYKFNTKGEGYAETRTPSYTDRILYKTKRKGAMDCLMYDSIYEVNASDHKPVLAVVYATIRPGKDNIPLCVGQCNRNVYLEAMRRRCERLDALKPADDTTEMSGKANNDENKSKSPTATDAEGLNKDPESYGYDFYPEREGRQQKTFMEKMFRGRGSFSQALTCVSNVYWCMENSPAVKLMLNALKKKGCAINPQRHISCEDCYSRVNGGFDPKANQVVICRNNSKNKQVACSVLAHELTHMYDYCRAKVDFKDLRHLACTEIRAANFWHCSFSSSWVDGDSGLLHVKKRHETCVKNKALMSILMVRDIDLQQAATIVDEVFEKCYNDLDPVGRRIRKNSRDAERAFEESMLRFKNK
ncbi:DgyrCDS12660 [Dimorphilus gyrociliatus]|uniref:DgyrCDS12660 n=1 Tax=Dimorphilus gyrociliatus TaxID=2664684 RepID=A0A7I8W8D8_9ANNE|nr:DgyrCDS12660 [Dimorphilus gyrociliatus]